MDLTNREITTELEVLAGHINDAMENCGIARGRDVYLDTDSVETESEGVKVNILRLNKTAFAPLEITVKHGGQERMQRIVASAQKSETAQRIYLTIVTLIESVTLQPNG